MKIKRNKFFYHNPIFLTLLFFFILIFSFDVPRKVFNIINLNYNQRLVKSYDFCGKRAVGFLIYIKDKYNLDNNVNIIKYNGVRNPYWIFFDRKKNKIKSNYFIFLNYNFDDRILFHKKNSFSYINSYSPIFNHRIYKFIIIESQDLKKIKSISVINDQDIEIKEFLIKKNIVGQFYKIRLNDEDQNIFNNIQKREKGIKIKINYIKKTNQTERLKIKIFLEHKYNINDFDILEKNGTCIFAKGNS